MKKTVLSAIAFTLTIVACSRAPDATAPAVENAEADPAAAHAELQSIGDDYLDAVKTLDPLFIYFGFTDVLTPDHAAMTDNSPQGVAAFRSREDALLARLKAIDGKALSDRADWVTWHALKESLEASVGQRVCESQYWSLNHMSGWQTYFPDISREQPVATENDRAAALARWSKFPAFIAQDRSYIEEGLSKGYSAPKSVVRRVIGQFDSIIAAPLEKNPFYDFATRAADQPEFQAEAKTLFENEIMPAFVSYRDYLRDTYLPAARDELAVKSLPKGAECYEASLRAYHSAQIGAEKTFERGKETVAANTQAVIERGKAMFGEEGFGEILQRVQDAPENRFASEEQLIEETRALVPVTREKSAPFFSQLPDQELIVEPFPDFLKGTGQSSRYEQKPAAEGPATYRIATDDWKTQTKGRAEIVVVHEGWPGHHLQIATARGLTGLHPATRLASSSAYIEGWARYAEALAEEAGIYNKYAEITRRAWPARGMVMDPGLHVYGWTREQAVAYGVESGNFTPESAEDLVDRIAVWPGQLTAYDTGGLEIFALRKAAEDRLGDKFDIREFHDRVLENGALPLGALREHVEAWIAEKEMAAQ